MVARGEALRTPGWLPQPHRLDDHIFVGHGFVGPSVAVFHILDLVYNIESMLVSITTIGLAALALVLPVRQPL
jgi:hypothetical protein